MGGGGGSSKLKLHLLPEGVDTLECSGQWIFGKKDLNINQLVFSNHDKEEQMTHFGRE